MKKALNILCCLSLIMPLMFPPKVNAETLGDLKKELEKQQQELSKNKEQKAMTESEINSVNSEIKSVENAIDKTFDDIVILNNEIDALNKKIAETEQQVKDIISFTQVSNGESAYLEYAFGAQDFTDFIYRVAIAEQLSKYNEELINSYNDMIKENEQKQKEIEAKRIELGSQQEELKQKKSQLNQELEEISSTGIDIEDEIKTQKEVVEMYEKMGCKDNESISTCGRSILPAGTTFYRPLVSGHITSEWGTRYYGGKSFHEGIDMGTPEGTPAYAVGTGKVAAIINRSSCGGNMVVVHHNINGKTYTTVYAHLLSINASVGQNVTKDTIIGYSGGLSTQSYDGCTGGAHLHLTVATGLYGVDYTSWSQLNYTYSINPRSVINYPDSHSTYWSDRITAY